MDDYPEFTPQSMWRIMLRKGITPEQIIATLGIEPRTFGRWSSGEAKPSDRYLFNLANVLGVTESALKEVPE